MENQTSGGIASVLSGDKPFKVEAQVNDEDLQKASLYIAGAVFVGMLLALLITRR